LLRLVSTDFREMTPNRAENYCCTGGGGAMSMSEYTPRRLRSAKVKADQIAATGAKIVVTSCHNCVDGLSDLIKHYRLGCQVKQLVDLVAEALVIPAREAVAKPAAAPVHTEAAQAKPALPLAGRRILVVDDEEDIRTFIRTLLEDAGAQTMEAAEGNQALAVARQQRPDLITLDLSMRGMDGIETFARLRTDPTLRDVPVCVVTGHPEFRKVIYQRAVPVPEGYLDKPVKGDLLLDNVRRILELKSARHA